MPGASTSFEQVTDRFQHLALVARVAVPALPCETVLVALLDLHRAANDGRWLQEAQAGGE